MKSLNALPRKVKRAILEGDKTSLKKMASAGGKASGGINHIKSRDHKDEVAYYKEKTAQEIQVIRIAANEHIVPIDPDTEVDA